MSGGPLISVIIPTRLRPAQLRQSLTSLSQQNYPRDSWEVVVVQDGPEDAIENVARELADGLPLRVFRQAHAGCGVARNTGAAQARGHFLVFTDDDCLFPNGWLAGYARAFAERPDCIIAGRSINALARNPYSETTQALMDYLFSRFNASREQATLAVGNNFGVPAAGFRELGGFSRTYYRTAAEDRDFCARWLRSGRQILFAPEIVVDHAHTLTFRSFLRQHFHYGRGAYLYHRLNDNERAKGRLESVEFYLSLLLWPWSAGRSHSVRLSLLLLIAQAAHTGGYVGCWLRGGLAMEAPQLSSNDSPR
jgi:glycosyltransferase involved in cell wall biosynthesis